MRGGSVDRRERVRSNTARPLSSETIAVDQARGEGPTFAPAHRSPRPGSKNARCRGSAGGWCECCPGSKTQITVFHSLVSVARGQVGLSLTFVMAGGTPPPNSPGSWKPTLVRCHSRKLSSAKCSECLW
jgi:hypothetical protein